MYYCILAWIYYYESSKYILCHISISWYESLNINIFYWITHLFTNLSWYYDVACLSSDLIRCECIKTSTGNGFISSGIPFTFLLQGLGFLSLSHSYFSLQYLLPSLTELSPTNHEQNAVFAMINSHVSSKEVLNLINYLMPYFSMPTLFLNPKNQQTLNPTFLSDA